MTSLMPFKRVATQIVRLLLVQYRNPLAERICLALFDALSTPWTTAPSQLTRSLLHKDTHNGWLNVNYGIRPKIHA